MRNGMVWLILGMVACGPQPTTSAGVPYAGAYALQWPQLTADFCGGACDANAFWNETPTWYVNAGTAVYNVRVPSGATEADVAEDALNFAIETTVSTADCTGAAVYMVTLEPQEQGCNVDLQARFDVRCHGTAHVCACGYVTTGSRTP